MAALISLIGGSVFAQHVSIDKDKSELWIEGRSNVNQFSCTAESYKTMVAQSEHEKRQIVVDIEVKGFECGKRKMNRDLFKTLLAEEHPYISFDYDQIRSIEFNDSEDLYKLTVTGNLTVAGHTKKIEFPMEVTLLEDGSLRAEGKTELQMTDYQVDPPTALFGLVRVEDRLTVHFELYASIPDSNPFSHEQL